MTQVSPEALYGDIVARASTYSRVSRAAAESKDAYMALHAAWAADICTIQSIVLERVMMASPQWDQQFIAVANNVSKALAIYARKPKAAITARQVIEAARDSLGAAFDDAVMELLSSRYPDLDHLGNLPVPDQMAGVRLLQQRLKGETPAEFMRTRRALAKTSMDSAAAYLAEGRVEEAIGLAYQADMSSFEAYLMESAVATGDMSFSTVELRWQVGCETINQMPALPGDFIAAISAIRQSLIAAVGPHEGRRLDMRLLLLPRA